MTLPTTLTGLVTRIRFKSPTGGFFVAEVDIREKKPVTLTGASSTIAEGAKVTAEGTWEQSKYGMQFKASKLAFVKGDPSEAGLLAFLKSGYVKGIGPAYAGSIMDAFGKDALKVLMETPQKLAKVKGFGPARVKTVTESIKSFGPELGTMVFLAGLGVSETGVRKILDRYGCDAENLVKEDPYLLCHPLKGVRGYGFKKADDVARNQGIDDQSPVRVRAAVLASLDSAMKEGSTGMEAEHLLLKTHELLKTVDFPSIELAIAACVKNDDLVFSRGIYFSASAHYVESYLANRFLEISSREIPDVETKRKKFEADARIAAKAMGIPIAEEQVKAVVGACTNNLFVVTGRPGAGKTTITKIFVDLLGASGLSLSICAPTGKAAKRASEAIGRKAQTIHRLLGAGRGGQYKFNSENPLPYDVVVVDEFSMNDIFITRALLKALKKTARLIIVGDPDQLASVGAGNVLHDMIHSGVVQFVRLAQVHRQGKGSPILEAAYRVGDGLMPALSDHGEFVFKTFAETEDGSHRAMIRAQLESSFTKYVNRGFDPIKDIQVLAPMYVGALGAEVLNTVFQKLANPNPKSSKTIGRTLFCTGDKVIQNSNNYDKEVMNGEIGYICALKEDPFTKHITVCVDYEDIGIVEYSPSEIGQISLAYVLTIHRCQGSEFPVVLMALDTSHFVMLQRNLIYTGITRAKKGLDLIASSKAVPMALKDPGTSRRVTDLKFLLNGQSKSSMAVGDQYQMDMELEAA